MKENLKERMMDGNYQFIWKIMKLEENLNSRDDENSLPTYPLLFLTCMDPRVDVFRLFQFNPGDVFVLRNAGNVYSKDMMRSILVAVYQYHIKQVIILGHLDCGMKNINLKDIKKAVADTDLDYLPDFNTFFKPIQDEIKNVQDHVSFLKAFPAFPSDLEIDGMICDVKSGYVFEIDELKGMDHFEEKYRLFLREKRAHLECYLNTHESEGQEGGLEQGMMQPIHQIIGENSSEPQGELIQAAPNLAMDLDPINIHVPKIKVPKISIKIPKLRIRTKHQDQDQL